MAKFTASELARHLELPLRGGDQVLIRGAAVLEDAGPDQLAFVASAKFYEAARHSRAGCLIAPPDFPGQSSPDQSWPDNDRAVIESPQPRAHFAMALALLYPDTPVAPGIHPLASVDPRAVIDPGAEIGPFVSIGAGARIGDGTRIGAGCAIGVDVTIGAGCTLHPRVSIHRGVTVGDHAVIHSGAVLGADGFGFELSGDRYHKIPQVGSVVIGNDVEIGANTCIDRATLGVTSIGGGTKLDNMVHIAHNCRIGEHVVIAAQTGLAGGVTIGDYAVVGGQVGVGDRARIEANAVIGSGAGILTSKIVRAGQPVWGTPARPLRQYLAQLATLARLAKPRGERGGE